MNYIRSHKKEKDILWVSFFVWYSPGGGRLASPRENPTLFDNKEKS